MKTKALILLVLGLAAGRTGYADSMPTVEFKGAFIKITAGNSFLDAPIERNPPQLLYIRKSSILRITMTYVARTTAFDVTIVTWGADFGPNPEDGRAAATDDTRSFFYRFAKESNAESFCDAILSSQDG
jgi:hypothetical protein